jgi:hypothetical protein
MAIFPVDSLGELSQVIVGYRVADTEEGSGAFC